MNFVVFKITFEMALENCSTGFAQIFDTFDQRTKFRITCFADAMNDETKVLNRIFITEFNLIEKHFWQTAFQRPCFVLRKGSSPGEKRLL